MSGTARRPRCEKEISLAYDPLFHSIDHYRMCIADLKENLGRRDLQGNYCYVRFPCHIRQYLAWDLNYLRSRGYDTEEYENRISVLDRELREFREDHLPLYTHQMLAVFRSKLYNPLMEHAADGQYFFERFIADRDYIEALRTELEPLADISADIEYLEHLDANVRKLVPGTVRTGNSIRPDSPGAPADLWWKHLKVRTLY